MHLEHAPETKFDLFPSPATAGGISLFATNRKLERILFVSSLLIALLCLVNVAIELARASKDFAVINCVFFSEYRIGLLSFKKLIASDPSFSGELSIFPRPVPV